MVTGQNYWLINLIHQSVTQSIMQHVLTVSASPHIYQLCKIIRLIKRSFLNASKFFSNQAALRKTIEIPLEVLNQWSLSHKTLKITSFLDSEIASLGILSNEPGSLTEEF